jgi:hypothetical protein
MSNYLDRFAKEIVQVRYDPSLCLCHFDIETATEIAHVEGYCSATLLSHHKRDISVIITDRYLHLSHPPLSPLLRSCPRPLKLRCCLLTSFSITEIVERILKENKGYTLLTFKHLLEVVLV